MRIGEECLVVELEDDSSDLEPAPVDDLAAPDLRVLPGSRLDALEETQGPCWAAHAGRVAGEEGGEERARPVRRGEGCLARVFGGRERLGVQVRPLPAERVARLERVLERGRSQRFEVLELLDRRRVDVEADVVVRGGVRRCHTDGKGS